MKAFSKLFVKTRCNIIGMLHVPALPGTPASCSSMSEILDRVAHETEIYRQCGLDGVIIENMHDTPYCHHRDMEPHITACMTVVGAKVRSMLDPRVPVGVQVLAAANKEALAVAVAAQLQFVRAEGFVFSHVADEGWIDACAGPLLRYRRNINSDNVAVFCDIKKKHSAHSVTADVDITETAKAAKFFRSDGVIITGDSTGHAASPDQVHEVINNVPNLPVLVGSGVTADNLKHYSPAHGLIIGSEFKHHGHWNNDIDPDRVQAVMEAAEQYRN